MFKKPNGVSALGLWMTVMMVLSLLMASNASPQGNPTITVTQGINGTITPGTVEVPTGTSKTFTITPALHYKILDVQAGPSGAPVSVYSALTWNTTNKNIGYYKFVNVTENQEITATFTLDTRKLTFKKSGDGIGTGAVTDDKALLSCDSGCTQATADYEYDLGGLTWPLVTLTAVADAGSIFRGWHDGAGTLLSMKNPYTVKMDLNKTRAAKFFKTYTLTTSKDGEGRGAVTTALVSGAKYADGIYKAGSVVAVIATPSLGSNFSAWSDGASGTTKRVNVTMDADKNANATFILATRRLTLKKSGDGIGTGTVTDDKALLSCDSGCTQATADYEYDLGGLTWPLVTLTAVADAGSIFRGWHDGAGTLLSMNNPYTVKMDLNKTRTAKFLKTYALTTSTDGDGSGSVSTALVSGTKYADGIYKPGSVVALTAKPSFGSNFSTWSDGASGTKTKVNVTMNADKNVNATFTLAAASKITTKVSVVGAKSNPPAGGAGVKALRFGYLAEGGGFPPLGSDYELDKTNVYVEERSAESFKTINEILCKIDQARYAEMLNKGPYKAQIDKKLCSSGKDSASGAGQESQNQSSGANMPDYELWTIDSSRLDDNSPHIIKAWIHQKGGQYEPDSLISAKVVITEGTSEANPYGLFTVNFKGSPVHPETGQVLSTLTLFYGFLKTELEPTTGKVLLKFADKFSIPDSIADQMGIDPYTFIEKATLNKTGTTGTGTAYTFEKGTYEGGPNGVSETFNFAFNNDYFLRAEVGIPDSDICLDRNNFSQSVWSYGLYDSTTGMRINRNSGFSIKKHDTVLGKDFYGWIGYWGVWFPQGVTVADGDEVFKITYGPGGTEDPYNIFKSGGKLKKHAKKTLTLGEITNIPLDYSEATESGYASYRAKWYDPDADGPLPKAFYKVEKLNMTTNAWEALPAPVPIDLLNLDSSILYFWSRALNGNVQVRTNCTWVDDHFECAADDSTSVVFYSDELVYPGDTVPGLLACFNNCPNVSRLTQANPFDDYSDIQIGVLPADSPHRVYAFDSDRLVLTQGDAPAEPVVTTTLAPNFQWGLMSGPLFNPTSTNLDKLACDMDGDTVNESTCGWLGWSELDEYYTWETGPNDWNQFTALENPSDGTILKFDPPLLVTYTHTWPDTTQSVFYLEYSGFGNLNGIPGKCVDPDTGEEMPCGPDSRWLPQFNIVEPNNQVTDSSDNVTKYYVKPLEMEQQMLEADPVNCETLMLKNYTLPDLATWVNPNIGPEPDVPGAPAVIGGVINEDGGGPI